MYSNLRATFNNKFINQPTTVESKPRRCIGSINHEYLSIHYKNRCYTRKPRSNPIKSSSFNKKLRSINGSNCQLMNPKQLSTLPSDIERNLKEHVKVVTLRSKKKLNELGTKKLNEEKKNVIEKKQSVEIHKPKENEVMPGRIHFLIILHHTYHLFHILKY